MNHDPQLASLHRRALQRRVAIVLACALPPLAAVVAICALRASIAAAGALAIAGIAVSSPASSVHSAGGTARPEGPAMPQIAPGLACVAKRQPGPSSACSTKSISIA